MKATVKYALINALKSGKYKRGTGCLGINNCFCVMGVLCELAVEAGVTPKGFTQNDTVIFPNGRIDGVIMVYPEVKGADHGYTHTPPPAVLRWAELDDRESDALIAYNDTDGVTFVDVVEAIEDNY